MFCTPQFGSSQNKCSREFESLLCRPQLVTLKDYWKIFDLITRLSSKLLIPRRLGIPDDGVPPFRGRLKCELSAKFLRFYTRR